VEEIPGNMTSLLASIGLVVSACPIAPHSQSPNSNVTRLRVLPAFNR